MEKIGKRRTCLNFPRCTCLVAHVDHAPPVRVPSIFNFFQQQKNFSCDRDLFTLKDLTLDIYRT